MISVERPRLLVATRSAHKLAELRVLLHLGRMKLVSLEGVGITDEATEPFDTFEANARAKARFYADRSGLTTLADDSGLVVDALGGAPGVRTRRYAGEDATDAQNNAKLLRELEGVAPEQRAARYVCVLSCLAPDGRLPELITRGVLEGRIAAAPRGSGGFGYDPIFEPLDERLAGQTVGQMSAVQKNRISHRAIAARAMGERLQALGF